MIRSYWKLGEEQSKEFEAVIAAKDAARQKAVSLVMDNVECDRVFISSNERIYLGYKEKKERDQLHKKPIEYVDGYHLYLPRAKSKINQVVEAAQDQLNEVISFRAFCKSKFRGTAKSVLAKGDRSSSFNLHETSFGFYGGHVVMLVPYADGEVDLSIIPEGFTQISEIELDQLKQQSLK